MVSVPNIEINLDSIQEGLRLWIDARRPNSLFDGKRSAQENNEAQFQLMEGCYYDYQISSSDYTIADIGGNIIQPHKRAVHLGTIAPNIFVGTLSIPLLDKNTAEECCRIELEVQSIKSGYRDDYRDMLEFITEKCTDLLLQAESPISQHFDVDYTQDSQTVYQKFAFIKSIIRTDEFAEAVHRIVTAPVTKWASTTEEIDIRNARRFSNANIKEIVTSSSRTKIPRDHYLRDYGLESLPERITTIKKMDSVDTPENRFIKHALECFLKFFIDINSRAKEFGHKKMEIESELLIRQLESQLHHSVFKDISRPTTLKLNSPVLQRKEGYREVLRVWLMFDLAAKLIWKGGDDVYSGGKKDIATLYEYWLFFKLLDLFQTIFDIKPKDISDLIQKTADGLNLQIKQGNSTALYGIYNSQSRKLNIRFNYNRSFSGKKEYPEPGSWTTTLRPDYTLSIWPYGISEPDAEQQELIVHIHFDAKYKIANYSDFLNTGSAEDLDDEKEENRKGIYKNADLLKMHAYKDAIRRSGGAYVLYPGEHPTIERGFHEIVPGLGAFPVQPSKNDNGIGELKSFILEVVDHFENRTSQREKSALNTFHVYRKPPNSDSKVKDALPEVYGANRDLIPDETFVIVAYYKSKEHLEWIQRTGLYNFRTNYDRGALTLDATTLEAKFILLHTKGDESTSEFWQIRAKGFRVTNSSTLERLKYPSKPGQDQYLIAKVKEVVEPEFINKKYNFKNLKNYKSRRDSALPFTTTLAELFKCKVVY